MAYFPSLPQTQTATLMTTDFLGLNKGLSIADGEFADMTNMTADAFPVMATRQPRTMVRWKKENDGGKYEFDAPQGIVGTEKLVVIDSGKVYVDGVVMPLVLSNDDRPKHMVCMGAYVCVWPDKKYINLANPDDYGDMGATWRPESGNVVSAMMCRKDGTNYDMTAITVSDTAPADPENGKMWLDTSGDNDVLKQYSSIYNEWVQVATTYIKIQATGIGKSFKEGDAIFLSNVSAVSAEQTASETDSPESPASETGTTETLTFTTDGFSLKSSFRTVTQSNGKAVSSTASTDERVKSITVSGIPEGASVVNSTLRFNAGTSMYGAKVLTVNGITIAPGANSISATVSGNGDASFRFVFQSRNPDGVSVGTHAGAVEISDIVLEVTYTLTSNGDGGEEGDEEGSYDAAKSQIALLNGSNILYGAGDDYIIVAGLIQRNLTLSGSIVAELRIPDLDYVCEANNRIWGCCYATVDGALVNELRACALGDFRNWHLYEGTSMDSYTMSVGSDGKFTGAYSLKGVPLFFKETVMHKVSGTQPSNFTLNTVLCRGVQDGCWRSLAQVGEVLYYKARTDVMAYDGALPYSVSEKLGTTRYDEAAAGAYRSKYYVCMRDPELRWHMLVYDTEKGLWHREDASQVRFFATVKGDMYFIQENATPARLMSINGLTDDPESPFDWSVTFGVYGYAYEGQKYLSRFNIRAQMAAKTKMKIEIMYDSDGVWVDEGEMKFPVLRTVMVPVIPRRCDHCQIRLSGTGEAKIYSVARVLENGGDG